MPEYSLNLWKTTFIHKENVDKCLKIGLFTGFTSCATPSYLAQLDEGG
jgi:hypothetical protein